MVERPAVAGRVRPPLSRTALALLLAAFAGATALRLVGVADSPLTFHPTRQFLGLRVARAEYLAGRPDVPAAVRLAVQLNERSAPQLEVRLLEAAVVAGYHLLGGERVWLGGTLSSILWVLLGGACLFLIARRLALGEVAAAVAVAFYLFLPYAITASRSFQPDPAMVAFMLAALLALLRHHDNPTAARLALAAALSASAILVKPTVMFVIVGAMAALAVSRAGLRGLVQRQTLTLFLLSLLPATVFYVHAIVAGTAVSSNAETSFIPGLFRQAAYWRGWLHIVNGTVGTAFVLAAALSIVVARRREARMVVAGLLAGYLVYGLVFNYHIHTHDYYSLPLIPIVALGLGLVADAAVARVRRMDLSPVVKVASGAALAVLGASLLSAGLDAARLHASPSPAAVAAQSRAIGEVVSHSTRTVMLAPAYGSPLSFFGNLSGSSWPSAASGDFRAMRLRGEWVPSTRQLFDRMRRSGAQWFIVTDLGELGRQPELMPLLDREARLAAGGPGYLVYDLRVRGPGPS